MEIDLIRFSVEKYLKIVEWSQPTEDRIQIIGDFWGRAEEESEKLARELISLGFYPWIRRVGEGYYEIIIVKSPKRGKSKPTLNIILFLLTVISTLTIGALQQNPDLIKDIGLLFSKIYLGVPFSFTLMFILLSHELGHYFLAKKHQVDATLPYFIPFPHPLVGTLGAFIRIRSPIPSEKALLDIGVAGPFMGMIVALPLTALGLHLSYFVPLTNQPGAILIGDSLLFKLLALVFKGIPPNGYDLVLHPIAYAGWLGFFVTALNLIPIGQLDGGHISYAMFGRKQRMVAKLALLALIILGVKWPGWWTWGILVVILGINHPAPMNEVASLDKRRKLVGILAFILLIITFIPVPFSLSK